MTAFRAYTEIMDLHAYGRGHVEPRHIKLSLAVHEPSVGVSLCSVEVVRKGKTLGSVFCHSSSFDPSRLSEVTKLTVVDIE